MFGSPWSRPGTDDEDSPVSRALVALWASVALMLVGVVVPTSSSALMWFDDEGEALYCLARHEVDGFGPVGLVRDWWVRSDDEVSFSCRRHPGGAGQYDISEVFAGRFGVMAFEVRVTEPGCARLTGGVRDRVELDACATNL